MSRKDGWLHANFDKSPKIKVHDVTGEVIPFVKSYNVYSKVINTVLRLPNGTIVRSREDGDDLMKIPTFMAILPGSYATYGGQPIEVYWQEQEELAKKAMDDLRDLQSAETQPKLDDTLTETKEEQP